MKKANKHNIEIDIELTLSDMDERITRKNDDNSIMKVLGSSQKISDVSKNSSIKTTKINDPSSINFHSVKYSKQYYISSLLPLVSAVNGSKQNPDPRVREHLQLSFDVIKKLSNCEAL